MKPQSVKIIQITSASSQEPGDIMYVEVHGLGDDGNLYYYNRQGEWVEA